MTKASKKAFSINTTHAERGYLEFTFHNRTRLIVEIKELRGHSSDIGLRLTAISRADRIMMSSGQHGELFISVDSPKKSEVS
jgi:hypothetical protein